MIQWKPELATGVKQIDEQHKNLVDICSRTFTLAKSRDEVDHYDEIVSLLEELRDYTRYHFSFEESLLEKFNYTDFEQQKMEHYLFLKRIEKMDMGNIDKDQTNSVLEILDMLVDWISSHIMNTDMKYAQLLKANGM